LSNKDIGILYLSRRPGCSCERLRAWRQRSGAAGGCNAGNAGNRKP